jgi:hypothetical protein
MDFFHAFCCSGSFILKEAVTAKSVQGVSFFTAHVAEK